MAPLLPYGQQPHQFPPGWAREAIPPDDPKPQIGELLRLADGDALQLDPLSSIVIEQPDASAEQHGSHVEYYLIEQAGPETLPAEAPTEDPDVLVSG